MSLDYLTQKELNTIRGKASVGAATPEEIMSVFGHYDLLESVLDESDLEEHFGIGGWRHYVGLPESM